jgi:hypothetical protein
MRLARDVHTLGRGHDDFKTKIHTLRADFCGTVGLIYLNQLMLESSK